MVPAGFPHRYACLWDVQQGDAQTMAPLPDEGFDFVHSSHRLEHLRDPAEGQRNGFRLLKSVSHLMVFLPDKVAAKRL
jgi:ubiquinone/menaquinone biosynthesis C-methylase UbiE